MQIEKAAEMKFAAIALASVLLVAGAADARTALCTQDFHCTSPGNVGDNEGFDLEGGPEACDLACKDMEGCVYFSYNSRVRVV